MTSAMMTMCMTLGRMCRSMMRQRNAEGLRRLDVFHFAQLQRLAAQQPAQAGPDW